MESVTTLGGIVQMLSEQSMVSSRLSLANMLYGYH